MSDTYRKIDCKFIRCTDRAVLISVDDEEHWIPRSCVFGPDETRLDDLSYEDEVELRIFDWICDRNGM